MLIERVYKPFKYKTVKMYINVHYIRCNFDVIDVMLEM